MKLFQAKSSKRGQHKFASSIKNPYLKEIRSLRKTIPEWEENFFAEDGEEARGNNWVRLDVLGAPLCSKYAWAVPNNRALNILAEFSPLIEIGCGKGYWASLLREMGVDVLCYDKKVNSSKCWTTVEIGGPKILKQAVAHERTLFLCYPDDSQNLAMKCLEAYSGDYIIHVGELITTGTLSGPPQAPFGRTTGSDFSVALAESFHCLLVAELPRFPFSRDCITVWKRTVFVAGKSAMLPSDDDDEESEEEEKKEEVSATTKQNRGSSKGAENKRKGKSTGKPSVDQSDSGSDNSEDEEEGDDEGEGEDSWASIPPEEVLPVDRAAPCLAHLLLR